MDGESEKRATPLSPTPNPTEMVGRNTVANRTQVLRHSPDSDMIPHRTTYMHNSHFFKHKQNGLHQLTLRHRRATLGPLQQWEEWEQNGRGPYHEYVHRLVESGWANLKDLDEYLSVDYEDLNLKISVVDIMNDNTTRHYEELHDDIQLQDFMTNVKPTDAKCRIYVAEQSGYIASSVMEAFGSALKLDPRFFQWHIRGSKHMLSIAVRHRVPFITLNFRILDPAGEGPTDTKTFKASIYVYRESPDFWTGVVFISSHAKVELSSNTFLTPPEIDPTFSNIPTPPTQGQKSFRELYLEMLETSKVAEAALSPFVAFSPLFKLNCYCFNKLMYLFRKEDAKADSLTEIYPLNLTEEIRRSLEIVQRGGSLGWMASLTPHEGESKERLLEDFSHALKQSELVWEAREKYHETRHRRSSARLSLLVNAFAFFFAPLSLMSSIYGMNVIEISGDDGNPSIWEFFLAVGGLCLIIMAIIAFSFWIKIAWLQHRKATLKDILAFAFGSGASALIPKKQKTTTIVVES